ncbi:MAG TPA: carboxypeptidase-like regulatory domain-containing protein [Tepidisphaeraceae bacterium]|nr:carboxypeptidase-like regulatory domain-containing protein [Tepidisphaeraceae bacterium]
MAVKRIKQPGVNGTVVDATTHQPIAGAVVELKGPFKSFKPDSLNSTETTDTQQVTADANGKFAIIVTHFTWWKPLYADSPERPNYFILTAHSRGYHQLSSLLSSGAENVDLGRIELQPIDEPKP